MSGSVSASKSTINSNYQSVTEQSGIKAGDGGFDVDVKGNTDLKGGVIAATDKAVEEGKNTFTTASLSMSDIENRAEYEGKAVGVNVGTGWSPGGKLAPQGTSAGVGSDSGKAASTTQSGISGIAGNTDVRSTDAETGIQPIFDAEKVQKEIDAQVAITQEFGQRAPRAAADFAKSRAGDLRRQALDEQNPEKQAALLEEAKKWDEGGAYRIALHTAIGGLAGGVEGAIGSGVTAGAAPLLSDLQDTITQSLKDAGASESIAKGAASLIANLTSAGLGAAVSGGSIAGAASGLNTDANNRQLHPDEEKWIKKNARKFAEQEEITEDEAMERLTRQALKDVDYLWRAVLADGSDASAQAFLAASQQTFLNDLGQQQQLFTAQGQQLFRPEMYADTADVAFYQKYAQSGVSRSVEQGLVKELKDSGIDIKNSAVAFAEALKDNPTVVGKAVAEAAWNAVKELPESVKNGFLETGGALGEGAAVAFDSEFQGKLNALYGVDVSSAQEILLTARIAGVFLTATGTAKTAEAAKEIGEKTLVALGKQLDNALDDAAHKLFKAEAGNIQGFRSAEAVNAIMNENGWAGAWKEGTMVADSIMQPGTKVRMVVDADAYDRIKDGKGFGGWATFDEVPNQAYARNNLAITTQMKPDVSYVVEVEITQPIHAQIGVVGGQGAATGGGNQIHFISNANRGDFFKFVEGSGRALQ